MIVNDRKEYKEKFMSASYAAVFYQRANLSFDLLIGRFRSVL